jgi:hypothetical protein
MRRVRVFDERLGQKPPDQPTWAGKYTQPNEAPATSSHNRRAIPVEQTVITPTPPPTDTRPERSVRLFFGTTEYTEAEYAQHDLDEAETRRQKLIDADRRRCDAVLRKQEAARQQWREEADAEARQKQQKEASERAIAALHQAEINSTMESMDATPAESRAVAKRLQGSDTALEPLCWQLELQELRAYVERALKQ